MDEQITIDKVAKRAGVNIQTVRYYEPRGMLLPSRRLESGYRLYPEAPPFGGAAGLLGPAASLAADHASRIEVISVRRIVILASR